MNGFELLKIEESNDIVIDTLKKEKKYKKQKRNLERKINLTNDEVNKLKNINNALNEFNEKESKLIKKPTIKTNKRIDINEIILDEICSKKRKYINYELVQFKITEQEQRYERLILKQKQINKINNYKIKCFKIQQNMNFITKCFKYWKAVIFNKKQIIKHFLDWKMITKAITFNKKQIIKHFLDWKEYLIKNRKIQCPICLNDELIQKCIKTDCNHIFCEECINKWIQKNITCPLCRKTIFINGICHMKFRPEIYPNSINIHNTDLSDWASGPISDSDSDSDSDFDSDFESYIEPEPSRESIVFRDRQWTDYLNMLTDDNPQLELNQPTQTQEIDNEISLSPSSSDNEDNIPEDTSIRHETHTTNSREQENPNDNLESLIEQTISDITSITQELLQEQPQSISRRILETDMLDRMIEGAWSTAESSSVERPEFFSPRPRLNVVPLSEGRNILSSIISNPE